MTPAQILVVLSIVLCTASLALSKRAPEIANGLTFLALVVLALGFLVGVSA